MNPHIKAVDEAMQSGLDELWRSDLGGLLLRERVDPVYVRAIAAYCFTQGAAYTLKSINYQAMDDDYIDTMFPLTKSDFEQAEVVIDRG